MCTTCMPAVMVCVTVNLDVPRFWSNAKYFYPRPPFSIHTLLLVSLTVRCCEINGHSEIDLSPRRGKEGRTSEKKINNRKQPTIKTCQSSLNFHAHTNDHTRPQETRGRSHTAWQSFHMTISIGLTVNTNCINIQSTASCQTTFKWLHSFILFIWLSPPREKPEVPRSFWEMEHGNKQLHWCST